MRVVTYATPTPTDVPDNAPPDEPYCVAIPSEKHVTTGVRWATCEGGESVTLCLTNGGACDEYVDSDRALACALDGTSARPRCVPLQYSFEERCADCDEVNVCVIRATGTVECVPMLPDTELSDGPACVRDRGPNPNRTVSRISDGMPFFDEEYRLCATNADCYFETDDLVARCAPVARQLARYPVRGCAGVSGAATDCYVHHSTSTSEPMTYRSTEPSPAPWCHATRVITAPPTPWASRTWKTSAEMPCDPGELCDLEGSRVVCTLPRWSVGTDEVCDDCVGVPCYVYEDGSYECMHRPTRTEDATRSLSATVGCCQRLPGGGFQPGTCSGSSGFAPNVEVTECEAPDVACAFTLEGDAECGRPTT